MFLSESFSHKAVRSIVGVLLAFAYSGAAQQLPPDCPSEDTKPTVVLAYLQQDRAGLDYYCVERAIHALGFKEYKPAIPTLIDYLDLKAPEGIAHLGPTNGVFPAAGALARFRGAAVPALRKAILDDNERKLVRVNAAITYIFISHRDEAPAIAFLAKAARGSGDRDAGETLIKVAEDEAKNCFAKDPKVCQ
jgi:hypothetical protein